MRRDEPIAGWPLCISVWNCLLLKDVYLPTMKLIFRAPIKVEDIGRVEQNVFDAYTSLISEIKQEKEEDD